MILRISFFGDSPGPDLGDFVAAFTQGKSVHVAPHVPGIYDALFDIHWPRPTYEKLSSKRYRGRRRLTLKKEVDRAVFSKAMENLNALEGRKYDWSRLAYLAMQRSGITVSPAMKARL